MRSGISATELVIVVVIIFVFTAVSSWSTSRFEIEEMRGMTEEQVRRQYGDPSVISNQSERYPELYPDFTEVYWDYSGIVPETRARVVFRDGVVTEVSAGHR